MNRKLDGLLKRMARVDIGDKNSLEAIDDMTEAAAALRAQQERIDALEAALKPFATFRIEGFKGSVLEVVPASPDNPARRIEPIWAVHFERAHATLTGEKQS